MSRFHTAPLSEPRKVGMPEARLMPAPVIKRSSPSSVRTASASSATLIGGTFLQDLNASPPRAEGRVSPSYCQANPRVPERRVPRAAPSQRADDLEPSLLFASRGSAHQGGRRNGVIVPP